jgi:uncharacterized protein (DUF1330 family)
MPAAYIVAEIEVTDPEAYKLYTARTPGVIAAHGGRFVVRGGAVERLEGEWSPARVVVIEFADSAKAVEWWNSPEYAEAKRLRQRCARTRMVLVEGA